MCYIVVTYYLNKFKPMKWYCQTKPNTSQSAMITQTYEAQIWNHFKHYITVKFHHTKNNSFTLTPVTAKSRSVHKSTIMHAFQ